MSIDIENIAISVNECVGRVCRDTEVLSINADSTMTIILSADIDTESILLASSHQ